MPEDPHQNDPAAVAWVCRLWLVFVHGAAGLLGLLFFGLLLMGILRGQVALMAVGAGLCYGLAILWRQVGARICEDLRRDRDRALGRRSSKRTSYTDW